MRGGRLLLCFEFEGVWALRIKGCGVVGNGYWENPRLIFRFLVLRFLNRWWTDFFSWREDTQAMALNGFSSNSCFKILGTRRCISISKVVFSKSKVQASRNPD